MLAIIQRDGKIIPIDYDWDKSAEIVLAIELPATLILEDLVINIRNGSIVALDMFDGACGAKDCTLEQQDALIRLAVGGDDIHGAEGYYAIAEPWLKDFPVRLCP